MAKKTEKMIQIVRGKQVLLESSRKKKSQQISR